MRVSQVLCGAGPVDAVTGQALSYRELFRGWGWGGEDYAAAIAPGMPAGALRPLNEFSPACSDAVVLHYSGFARGLEELLDGSDRTLLLSHNITPSEYFWAVEPVEGVRCELGRGQLARLAARAGALAGVSAYNARELTELTGRDAEVIPVLFSAEQLGPPGPPKDGPPTVLFVGRLAPHKRQDLVIGAVARLRAREPRARLDLIGMPLSPDYGAALRAFADECAPGAVAIESGISREQLAERYRAASVFLCLSEHEGFCIPLLEAFHFGVPVIARDSGAVGEVVADAGILLSAEDSLATVSELLGILISDGQLSAELRERGRRRLEVYDPAESARRMRERLERLSRR